jgi:hypothetical protein
VRRLVGLCVALHAVLHRLARRRVILVLEERERALQVAQRIFDASLDEEETPRGVLLAESTGGNESYGVLLLWIATLALETKPKHLERGQGGITRAGIELLRRCVACPGHDAREVELATFTLDVLERSLR